MDDGDVTESKLRCKDGAGGRLEGMCPLGGRYCQPKGQERTVPFRLAALASVQFCTLETRAFLKFGDLGESVPSPNLLAAGVFRTSSDLLESSVPQRCGTDVGCEMPWYGRSCGLRTGRFCHSV